MNPKLHALVERRPNVPSVVSWWRQPDIYVGASLGCGFFTTLRLGGVLGLSECFMIVAFAMLFTRHGANLLRPLNEPFGVIRGFLLCSVFLQLPIVSLLSSEVFLLETQPRDIAIFAACIILFLLMLERLRTDQNLTRLVTVAAGAAFAAMATAALFLPSESVWYEEIRFTGGATNPNQLVFYMGALLMLAARYTVGKVRLVIVVVTVMSGAAARSDAFGLSMLMVVSSFFILRTTYVRKFSAPANCALYLSSLVAFGVLAAFAFPSLFDQIEQQWSNADEGGVRIAVYLNAIAAVGVSPLLGLGAGAFSGMDAPFSGMEAHNTPLDFAMTFGVPLPLTVYGLMLWFVATKCRQREFFVASTALGFILLTQFHFVGRHFVFWVVLAAMVADIYFAKPSSVHEPHL